MKRKGDVWIAVFGLVFILALILLINQQANMTGYATTATTISNVTIQKYFAIEMSVNLSDGIQFGTISTLPATNQNATHNHDHSDDSNSTMFLNVSDDSNTAVDFCILGEVLNTSGGDEIEVGNESFANHTSNTAALPAVASEVSLTGSYAKCSSAVAAGSEHYYRFWLDVPAATSSGVYNNTVFFKGVETAAACA